MRTPSNPGPDGEHPRSVKPWRRTAGSRAWVPTLRTAAPGCPPRADRGARPYDGELQTRAGSTPYRFADTVEDHYTATHGFAWSPDGPRLAVTSGAGTAPVTKASGTRRIVLARYKRLGDAAQQWAISSMRGSAGATAYYQQLRARGTGHQAALRQLSNRWIGILHGLKTGTTYDEHTAWNHHMTRVA